MSIKAKLIAFGVERDLLTVTTSNYMKTSFIGKPKTGIKDYFTTVTFVAEMYDCDILGAMGANRFKNERLYHSFRRYKPQEGKIVFCKEGQEDITWFEYGLKDAIPVSYHVDFDSQNSMIVTVVISAAVIDLRFFPNKTKWNEKSPTRYVDYGWAESYSPLKELFSNDPEIVPDKQPRIGKITWLEKNESTDSTKYGNTVALEIRFINPKKDEKAKITITKQNESKFDENTKELIFEQDASNGNVRIDNIQIKKEWENFKKDDIDKLVAKVEYAEKTKQSEKLEIIPQPKIIVDFRPSKNYSGEYGFDYIRDEENKEDYINYEEIVGVNSYIDYKLKKRVKKFKKIPAKFEKLKNNEYKTMSFDWYKNKEGKQATYTQSWLTMYPNQTVTLSLQIETIENPKKLDIFLEFDKELFKLNKGTIPAQGKKNTKKRLNDFLTIECLKEFSTDQTIKVMYGNRQMGQLNILANAKSKRKTINVVFVEVKTTLIKGFSNQGNSTEKKKLLEKYLKQALITPNIVTEVLDLRKDLSFNKKVDPETKGYITNKEGIHDYLNDKVNNKYTDYLKVYFIGDECPVLDKKGKKTNKRVNGSAKDFNSDAVVLFYGHNSATTAHEALHALGLYHTFSAGANYTYKKGETYNIMDYSHWPIYGSKNRMLTWLWQWKKIRTNGLVKQE